MRTTFLPLAVIAMDVAIALLASETLAQDYTSTRLEAPVAVTEFRGTFLPDGGCDFQATGTTTTSTGERLVTTSDRYALSGARCTTVRTAALKAVKNSFRVGDGGAP